MVKLMVFLGNPGREYARTRHNIGWMVCDHHFPNLSWSTKFHAQLSSEGPVRLLRPQTYMNESGKAVRATLDFFHLEPNNILVVHDDLELPYGTLRLQAGGGLQGHNGLKSIKQHVNSDQFLRLRIGIGRPKYGSVASFVLERFTSEEEVSLTLVLDLASSMLDSDISSLPVTNTLV